MNVDIEAVRASLDERIQMGRSPVEGAGEILWLTQKQQDMDVLSKQTGAEITEVIAAWLAEQMRVSVDEVGPYILAAEQTRSSSRSGWI